MSLGEPILKFCSVGVHVPLAGSDLPASIGISVEPYETNVESWVGYEREDLRFALIASFL